MTETMLTTLDRQMALSDTAQDPKGSLNEFLISGQVYGQSEIKSREPRSIPMSFPTYICLLLRIIRSVTSFVGMQIECWQTITPWYW